MVRDAMMQFDGNQRKFEGLVQDCSISIANAMEILQSCNKSSNWSGCNGTVLSNAWWPVYAKAEAQGDDLLWNTAKPPNIIEDSVKITDFVWNFMIGYQAGLGLLNQNW